MFRSLWILIMISILISACAPATQATPIPITDSATATPSPLPTTATRTAPPTATLTASITPLPAIPTFTPTFDVSTIVTVTSAPKAECPKENPELVPDFPYCNNMGCSGGPYNEATVNYLNAGGTLDKLEQKHWGIIADLTGDNTKELIYAEFGSAFIYGCKEGKYEVLSEIEGTQNTPVIDYSIDLNQNGISEIIFSNYERRYYHSIHIIEWNGKEFIPLIKQTQTTYTGETYSIDWIGGTAFDYKITDIDNNGLKEIVANDNSILDPEYLSELPLRQITTIIGWDGKSFVILSDDPSPPEYRFQAIQDADKLILHRQYERALSLYQDAIFSDKLGWWSQERKIYESKTALDTWFQNAMNLMAETATPFPTLAPVTPDTTEYPRLAAYAYYRIMLIHIVQNHEADASTVYNTLQEKFGNDPYGQPYVEMAARFGMHISPHKKCMMVARRRLSMPQSILRSCLRWGAIIMAGRVTNINPKMCVRFDNC